jgi:hypothetical protein
MIRPRAVDTDDAQQDGLSVHCSEPDPSQDERDEQDDDDGVED